MIKNIHKKILIISLLVTIFLIIISNNNQCFALSDVTNDIGWTSWEPTIKDDSELVDKTGTILGVIRTIGIVVSVGTLAFIGIKFMWGSVEEKANYKQTLIPWILGATMVFTITTIPTIIYDMTNGALTIGVNGDGYESYLEGYDAAMEWAINAWTGSSGLSDEEYRQIIEEQKSSVQISSAYWQGYSIALDNILDNNSPAGYAAYSDMIASDIKDGKITTSNIVEKCEEWVRKVNNSTQVQKEMNQVALNRLIIQAREWGMEGALYGVGEYIEQYKQANTWEDYANGYDDAVEWAQSIIKNNENIILARSKGRKDEILRYGFAYWNGYGYFLDEICNLCKSSTEVKSYIEGHKEIVSLINTNRFLNVDSLITTFKRELYNNKGELNLQSQAKITRLEIQKHISNGDEFSL